MFLNAGVNVYASPKTTIASKQVKAQRELQTKMWDYKDFIDQNKIVEKVKEILYTDLQYNEINFYPMCYYLFFYDMAVLNDIYRLNAWWDKKILPKDRIHVL